MIGGNGDGERAVEAVSVRVLVVDDHLSFAEALQIVLEATPGVVCIGVAGSGEDAIAALREIEADVVLIDLELPGIDGIETTRFLRAEHPSLRVVVLTGHSDVQMLLRAAEAGASAFLPKEAPLQDVVRSLRTPGEGRVLIEGPTLGEIVTKLRRGVAPPADSSGLSHRELEVLRLLGEGLDPRQVAERLNLSIHTCRTYVKTILSKLNAHSQLEAVILAARRGLIPTLEWHGDPEHPGD